MHIRNVYELRVSNGFPPIKKLLQQQGSNVHQLWPPIRNEALLAVSWHCKDLTRNQENDLQESSCPVQMSKACLRNSTFESQMTLAWTQVLAATSKWKLRRRGASAWKTSESLHNWHSDMTACAAGLMWTEELLNALYWTERILTHWKNDEQNAIVGSTEQYGSSERTAYRLACGNTR
jgi:hypothetical protein